MPCVFPPKVRNIFILGLISIFKVSFWHAKKKPEMVYYVSEQWTNNLASNALKDREAIELALDLMLLKALLLSSDWNNVYKLT